MKLSGLKLLYVCNDFPYPPLHGGCVDMWNRIKALHKLGVHLDVIATVKDFPGHEEIKTVRDQVRTLRLVKRKSFVSAFFHWKPMLVAVRGDLNSIQIDEVYDVVLMQSEFVTEILRNRTIKWRVSIIRVDNNEYSYHIQAARAQHSFIRKLIYLQEALRIRMYSVMAFKCVDMLWFVSHTELTKFNNNNIAKPNAHVIPLFMPTALDLTLMNRPSLNGKQVLFVGNLFSLFNRTALEWYISNVHAKLIDIADYRLVVAGSSLGSNCEWLNILASHSTNINIYYDVKDLSSIYNSSALFVNPMQCGAGVKLKTVEAGVRGLPILSTSVGVEGTGFIPNIHFMLADNAQEFCLGVRSILDDKALAAGMVERCQKYLQENYDQKTVLKKALEML